MKERSNKGKKRGPYKNRTLKLVENYKSNENRQNVVVKKRKQRSNKGKKRGPRKRALQLVENYNSNNNNTPVVKKRKQRSNKGKKRGPYRRGTKHKIPNIVVNDYNNTQRANMVNQEWKEVENILFNTNSNNNRPLVKRKNKNNRPLARTRSGRAFRK